MNNDFWFADLHMHTNLSYCAPKTTVPETFLPLLESEQVKICGFSNHLYYDDWIADRDKSSEDYPGACRVLSLRSSLEEMSRKTTARILLGCEVETVFGREPSLPKEKAKEFDYVLLAASHILNISHAYKGYDLSSPNKLRDLILERFVYSCGLDFGVPTGICHPLYPICSPEEQEVVDGIPDHVLRDCFTLAKKGNKSIEIHACLFRNGTKLNDDGVSPSYLRLLSIAADCGCKFHFGGDAHGAGAFTGIHEKLRKAAESVGITPEDMWII